MLGEVQFSDVATDESTDLSRMSFQHPLRPKPNAFLAVRITDPGVQQNIRKFHSSVTAADPRLHEICQPGGLRSHVALDAINIDDGAEEAVLDAVRTAAVAASLEQGHHLKQI